MKNNYLKLIFCKKSYIDELCDYYGNPHEVRDYLISISKDSRILSKYLRKDIEEFDRAVEEEYEYYLESQNSSEEREERGGCFDCPWGNGEGGCTIPGYCPNMTEE